MQTTVVQPSVAKRNSSALAIAVWSASAAFGAYFCMYAFRKPFTAASFDGSALWGISEKTVLVTAQVLGYMVSKFIGIRVIAEMPPKRRAVGILILVGTAEAALVLFGIAPRPWHVVCLFLNGLPLGMVFGLVVGFLEGRRHTEALAAGLCASFILADGFTKSVGTWLLTMNVTERWMPALAGLMFLPLLILFVWMLTQIPPPTDEDIARRSERRPMSRQERFAFLAQYAVGLFFIVAMYLLITIARSIRADFAPEIWRGLGVSISPHLFTISEFVVALGVLFVNGLSILIIDNRRAFFTSLRVAIVGAVLMIFALVGLQRTWLGGFQFMVLLGLGLYLPYVAVHTTIFERLIAATRTHGNLGFLMYVADSIGYLGYVAVILSKGMLPHDGEFMSFFALACWTSALLSIVCVAISWFYFARKIAPNPHEVSSL